MEDVFNTGRAHLETRIKKMAEITKEVIQFNEAMAQIDIAKAHLQDLVFKAFVENYADEKGYIDTQVIKKSIAIYAEAKKEVATGGDARMEGWLFHLWFSVMLCEQWGDDHKVIGKRIATYEDMIIWPYCHLNLKSFWRKTVWRYDHTDFIDFSSPCRLAHLHRLLTSPM